MRPKVSFVVTARNDNYGGDFLQRMQAFVNVLLTLCERHYLNMELVIVEWNPPKDNPRLADALMWIDSPKYCKIRVIEVPEEIHRQLPDSERMPLFEFVGKNVGVRRAQGDYILVTNPDILFTEELIQFLASGKLSPKCFYRVTRYDVKAPAPLDIPVEKQLAYCKQHIIRINGYLSSFEYCFNKRFNPYRMLRDFVGYLMLRLLYFPFDIPFTNASGDFFMMHQSHWHSLRGYPEIKGADSDGRLHTDSFMMYMALFHGLKQIRLRRQLRIYHQEHGRQKSRTPFSPEVESTRRQLLKAHKPIIFNDETWGLGMHDLPETVIA